MEKYIKPKSKWARNMKSKKKKKSRNKKVKEWEQVREKKRENFTYLSRWRTFLPILLAAAATIDSVIPIKLINSHKKVRK